MDARRLIVLSPHPDDACLSLDTTLRQMGCRQTLIVTVFSSSRFAPVLRGVHGRRDAVTCLRREEDVAYCRSIGAFRLDLGLSDCTVRWVDSDDWWRSDGELEAQSQILTWVLDRLSADHSGWSVLAPLGLGGHPDHLATRDAAIQSFPSERLAFYEDMPYAASVSEEAIADVAASVGAAHPGPEAGGSPKDGLAYYTSQIRAADLDAIAMLEQRRGGFSERVWLRAPG